MFWIISVIFVLIALAFVLPSLLSKRNNYSDVSREQNIHIANEQLQDLERRFGQGEIESKEYQSTRDELEQSLFLDISGSDITVNEPAKNSSPLTAVFIALLIPVITIPIYLNVGNLPFTKMLDSKQAAAEENDRLVPKKPDGTPDVDAMIAGLQKKMEANPDNFKGWIILGRSYMAMRRYTEAAESYERALKINPKSVNVILAMADSLAMANNGEVTGRPVELIDQALELEPENLKALLFGGMAARQQGEQIRAIQRWKKVLSLVTSPSERQEVNSLIDEAMSQLTPEQKIEVGASASVADVSSTGASITVSITLSEKFKAQVKPTDLVFVYAKAMSGPPMPLAVVRKQVKDFPLVVELNDAMAMIPSLKLSAFSEVVVGARISKSGQPTSQNGDLYSEISPVKAGDKISLKIDSVVSK